MGKFTFITLFIICIFFSKIEILKAQTDKVNTLGQFDGFIPTAVPFLLIAPDARALGIAGAGAASTPDIYSVHWNASKLSFLNSDFGISVSYLPWLRQLINDVNYLDISSHVKIGSSKIATQMKYFALGPVTSYNKNGTYSTINAKEYSYDLAYIWKFATKTSGSIAFRYIYSDMGNYIPHNNQSVEKIKAFSFDLSMFHIVPLTLFSKYSQFAYGFALTNVGPVIKNVNDSSRFLPTNLRVGTSLKITFNEKHAVEIVFDANKLLAPDNPGNYCDPSKGYCLFGPQLPKSWREGFFGSFSNASEINLSTGIEYWYHEMFAFRTGYFYENPLKGKRQFFTLGTGIRYKSTQFDLCYIIPKEQRNPLENTLSFSLSYTFKKLKENKL